MPQKDFSSVSLSYLLNKHLLSTKQLNLLDLDKSLTLESHFQPRCVPSFHQVLVSQPLNFYKYKDSVLLSKYSKASEDGDTDNKDLSKFLSHLDIFSDNTLPE